METTFQKNHSEIIRVNPLNPRPILFSSLLAAPTGR
jgi:hypothetical protein